ncbi:hypothetical protein ACHAXS_000318 [Conticribra weissflogii]
MVWALYCLWSAGRAFHKHTADCMHSLGYKSCLADPDLSSQLWIRKNFMPLGKPVDVLMFVDSDHTWDKQTRCSCSSFLIYINTALVDWHSKQQATIKT